MDSQVCVCVCVCVCVTSPQRCWRHPGPSCQSPRRGSLRATSAAAGPFGGLAGLTAALCGASRHTDDGAAFRLGRLPPTWRSRARRSCLRSSARCPRSASPTAPCATPSLGGRGAPGSGAGRLDACCSAASAPASGASGRVWQLQAGDAAGGVACGGSSRGTGAAADALEVDARAVPAGKQRSSASPHARPQRSRRRAPRRASLPRARSRRRPLLLQRRQHREALGPRCRRSTLPRPWAPRVVGAGPRAGRAPRLAKHCATHRSGSRAAARPSAARTVGATFACLVVGVPRRALPSAPAAFAATRRSFGGGLAAAPSSPARSTTGCFRNNGPRGFW